MTFPFPLWLVFFIVFYNLGMAYFLWPQPIVCIVIFLAGQYTEEIAVRLGITSYGRPN